MNLVKGDLFIFTPYKNVRSLSDIYVYHREIDDDYILGYKINKDTVDYLSNEVGNSVGMVPNEVPYKIGVNDGKIEKVENHFRGIKLEWYNDIVTYLGML